MEGSGSELVSNGSRYGSGRPKTYGSYGSESATLLQGITKSKDKFSKGNQHAKTWLPTDLSVKNAQLKKQCSFMLIIQQNKKYQKSVPVAQMAKKCTTGKWRYSSPWKKERQRLTALGSFTCMSGLLKDDKY
jgi:hypothetical protein